MSILQVEQIVRDKVDAYEDEFDLWKSDHELAMMSFDIQELIHDGITLFRDICRLDENWRLAVFEERIPYDLDFEEKLRSLVQRFHRTTSAINRDLIPSVKKTGHSLDRVDEFRGVCAAVKGMVTPDDEFFCDDALLRLQTDAIDDHNNGRCIDYDTA